jgi:peptidoglycan/LPS O-acetylase OafA/YrhL
VLGFLIVSGYSIGNSLQRRPEGFFRRRVLRIYPLYFIAVLYALVPFLSGADALFTATPMETIARPHAWVVLGNLLMLQNLICPPVDSNMLVWTLGIEVTCYLLAPWFRRTRTFYLLLIILGSALVYSLYPQLQRRGYGHYATLLWGIPLLMFAWAWLAGFLLQRSGTSLIAGSAVVILCVGVNLINTAYAAPYSVACVAGAAALVTLAPRLWIPARVGPVLNYLGDLSYPLYLFHLPTFLLGYCIMDNHSPLGLVAMSLAVSAGFLFIESTLKPVLGRPWGSNAMPTAG